MDNILLTKGGETRTVKAGNALYMLLGFIPVVGGIIFLVLSIIKKQFRGICLNELLWSLIIAIIAILLPLIGATISLGFAAFLSLIDILAMFILAIYIFVHLILNANKYSLAQYIKEGYEVSNMDQLDEKTKSWIEENKEKERAKFLLLKF